MGNDWTLLHAKLHQTLRERKLLPQGRSLLVAVSGGQDSLCLIRLLLDLQPKWGWQMAIAHCNHRWRSDASANADYVQQLAQTWQIPCFVVTAEADLTSEASARSWRYQALAEIAMAQGCSYIVTGHTASDRAETLLYNLVRGSGADGLQALVWRRELAPALAIVRPLLEITRVETGQFCQEAQLQVWQDSTNQDWRYARNRIRQDLLPYLQTHFNPQVESALSQTAELLRAEVEYLETITEDWWQKAIASSPQDFPAINRLILRAAPLALQRRVMRRFLLQYLPSAPNFDHTEKLVALIRAPNRSQTDPFPGGAIARVEQEWIRWSSGE
ncbi:MAG: tRNA lysidine(34) synthetase TilS [Drouetiella hepatica Uher 2000/2452]|jgi:tRNA(Ile)-lysidine synthase|uniref:tRNA(Ile)-lysidine synthase n=1 Tax=Drouetiella hepatica Uher 2000/2452 TaxID=904376 RepID=A0A951UMD4_9CYAN|nr:tRNA lysidine(34) synthetase TilS [Drouetiella hepatica Uher 2000/2452]